MAQLTQGQSDAYTSDGYVLVEEPVFPIEMFDRLRAYAFERYASAPPSPSGVRPQLIDCPHWADPSLFEWIFSDQILDLIEPLTGPNMGLFATHFLVKPPNEGKRVPWHEDSAYWNDMVDPMEVVSINVALEPWTDATGCLRVIPGTHTGGYSSYEAIDASTNVFHRQIVAEEYDESEAVSFLLNRNQASIHDSRIQHASEPNTSDEDTRMSYCMRFFPTTSKAKVTETRDDFPVYLARGEDLAGNSWSDASMSYAIGPIY